MHHQNICSKVVSYNEQNDRIIFYVIISSDLITRSHVFQPLQFNTTQTNQLTTQNVDSSNRDCDMSGLTTFCTVFYVVGT